jgi:hypothetical protein
MSFRACLSAFLGLAACAAAETPVRQSLTDEQIRGAEFLDLSIPNAGELFAAFGKVAKPDWSALFRKAPQTSLITRPIIALNLGTLIADGFLAAEAQDRQQVKNVSREIKLLAKSLGLEQEFVGRNNSIADFADGRRWEALDEELEAVQSEFAIALNAQHDDALVTLMSLGCWLRSLEIVSAHLGAHYTVESAAILRQPAVSEFFTTRLDAFPAKVKTIPVVAEIQRRLPALGAVLSLPAETPPTSDAVTGLKSLTTGMLNFITAPEK